tara:strand:- start:4329 stop:5462 length:1134 start_codon:yes stop_codon:yes gene_type:complete
MKKIKNKKILYIVSDANFFLSHRIDIALMAKKNGYEIHLASIQSNSLKTLKSKGIITHSLSSTLIKNKIFLSLNLFFNTFNLIRKINPNIIQIITIFNVLSSGLSLLFLKNKNIIFSISGLGYLFTEKSIFTKIVKTIFLNILFLIFFLKQPKVIFQNKEDYKDLDYYRILDKKNIIFIKGSGVNTKKYNGNKVSCKNNILFASRLLVHKGINEFLEAAKIIKNKYKNFNFIVAGKIDYNNPSFIKKSKLIEYKNKKIITYVGYKKNLIKIFKKTSIFVLPSYREGTPKVLIEAMSFGLPIIASKISGCKTIIRHNKNGILIPIKNPNILANAIVKLHNNKRLMDLISKNGKKFAKDNLDIKLVTKKHLKIYNHFLK